MKSKMRSIILSIIMLLCTTAFVNIAFAYEEIYYCSEAEAQQSVQSDWDSIEKTGNPAWWTITDILGSCAGAYVVTYNGAPRSNTYHYPTACAIADDFSCGMDCIPLEAFQNQDKFGKCNISDRDGGDQPPYQHIYFCSQAEAQERAEDAWYNAYRSGNLAWWVLAHSTNACYGSYTVTYNGAPRSNAYHYPKACAIVDDFSCGMDCIPLEEFQNQDKFGKCNISDRDGGDQPPYEDFYFCSEAEAQARGEDTWNNVYRTGNLAWWVLNNNISDACSASYYVTYNGSLRSNRYFYPRACALTESGICYYGIYPYECHTWPAFLDEEKFGTCSGEEDIDHGKEPIKKCPICPCPDPEPDLSVKGNPVRIYNGNNIETVLDLNFNSPFAGGFDLRRYYNSRSKMNYSMGYGWTHSYSAKLTPNYYSDSNYIKILDETGRGVYFVDQGGGHFAGRFAEKSRVELESGNYVWYRLDGLRFVFNSQGVLIRIEDTLGNTTSLTYDANNRLETVTDEASGRVLTFTYDASNRIQHIHGPTTPTVPSGTPWVTYGYDSNDNLISVTYEDGSGFDYQYTDPNDPNNLTRKLDKAGHFLSSWTYDNKDRVSQNETSDGKGVTIDYDTSAPDVLVTDAYGVTRIYTVEDFTGGRKRVTNVTGASGCSTCGQDVVRAQYDNALRISEKEYANGKIDRFEDYDSQSNARIIILAAGTNKERTLRFTYDETHYPESKRILTRTETSALDDGSKTKNKVTIRDYDNDYNAIPNENPTPLLSRIIEKGFTVDNSGSVIPYEYITTYHYNSKGQPESIDGPLSGNQDTVTMTYDPATGNLLTVSQPLIGTIAYANYDAAGNPGSITDENQIITNFTYDGRNRIVSKVVNGVTTHWNYTLAGNIDSITDGAGRSFTYAYGSTYGLLERVTDPLGNSLRYTYDDKGNRIEDSSYDTQNVRQRQMRFDYHGPQTPGRLWKIINPDNTEKIFSYDQMGNVSKVVDELNHATNYSYDLFNRLTTVTQPGSVVTGYGYDSHNNLDSVTDAENHGISYVYDDLKRQVSVTSPDTGTTAYTYDADGNLVSKSDANAITVTYTYDALNRLTGIHYPDSVQDITYSYDAGTNGMGRLTGMTDQSGAYSYSYDVFGNLVTEEKTIEGVTYTTGYTYDPTGVLTRITYPYGREVSHTLDNAGRVAEITTTSDSITKTVAQNINYLPFGPAAGLTYGNGTQITKAFDQRYQLTAVSAGDIQNLNYTISPAGNITAITDNLDPGKNQTFGYDDLYRLTSAGGIYGTASYTYDNVGNRLTKTLDSETDNYTYTPGSNRLGDITGANPETLTYDDNGNMTAKGPKTLTYNQNNRLIQVAENSAVSGEYTYNGNGQRIKKTAGDETIIFHYDIFGNIIGESTAAGNFIEQYIYLGNERLSVLTGEAATEIAVEVTSSKGGTLTGINVYAFTESGSYTGKSAVTDESGTARFDPFELTDGSYKFRADYLSYQFWSENITLPGQYSTDIQVAEETATILVTQGGIPKEGVKVYLFNADGAYLGLYQTTDQNGNVRFDLPAGHEFKFRADILGSQFMSETISIISGGPNNHTIASGGGTLTVTVDQGEDTPIPGIHIYLFTTSGSYLGLSDMTDTLGQGTFEVPSGTYKVRADYLGYQFWSQDISVTDDKTALVSIPHQDVTLTVNGDYDSDVIPLEDLNVYLFTASESYLSLSQVTDGQGQIIFHLPQMDYKVRADYLSGQYWSPVFNWTNETITIDESMAQITVTNIGQPLEGINVYVFTAAGSYLNISDATDINGHVAFRLPAGDYNFRADYMGNQYFSGVSTLIAHVSNPVNISTGGGSFNLTVLKGPDNPLIGVKCYLFSESGSYLGQYQVTNDQGEAGFDLADGSYKIRIDYLGYQFWTDILTIPADTYIDFTIPHQDVTVTVTSDYNGDVIPLEGLNVYLFTPSESYLSQYQVTDNQGQVTFNLPQMDYKVRTDCLSGQYWSQVFNWTDETVTINESMAEVHVTQGSTPIEGVNVYVFNLSGSYLGVNGQTDQDGIVSFSLPEGTYKFRGDYQGSQFWATEALTAHQVNVVNLSTGGGSFALSVEKESGSPLVDIPVYVFSSSGSYLGINAHTDDQGQVTFDLADGDYKFRADYFGYQFWSNVYNVPGTLSDVLTITHQDVTITVNQIYGYDTDPLQGINVYLFTGSGSYQWVYQITDTNGQVTFNLPEKNYKVRADYLSQQHWSDVFSWQDVGVDINHGTAILHVTHNGQDVFDVPVYLFSASDSYLGRFERTDSSGQVQFLLPASSYKFRVDYDGTQYWSDVISIIPHEENSIDLQLELLADLTNDPNPDRFDGVPPVYEPEKIMVASLGSIRGLLLHSVVGQTAEVQKIYYFINDHLGTPQKLLDESADVVWSAGYKPFGEADVNVNTFENRFRFPGQYFDETGLHYNYHRFYDPSTGRYLRADPIGLAGGINPYIYANLNPINFVDPLGLETLYERIHPSFFNDLKKYNPVEHNLFTKYTKGINTDLWTDDLRWLELSWKKFDPYARQGAADMISEGCEETYKSIYGPESWLSKYLGGLPRLLFGTHSDIDTAGSAASLIEISDYAYTVMINGPTVVNETTWIEAFGRPYTPGLR